MSRLMILYLTDNSLEPSIAEPCQKILVREAQGIPIVSVSQQPIDFGQNVCVGEIGRSWMSLYRQLLAGLEVIDTEFVAIAEHDCLYTHEHFSFVPPDNSIFWYNSNCWYAQWHGNHPELEGMYSFQADRTALSQLICVADLLRQSTADVLHLLEHGLKVSTGYRWYGEPGVVDGQLKRAAEIAASGSSVHLSGLLDKYAKAYEHRLFATEIPNIDIRHGTNFTGPKRWKLRRYELPYWGRFEEVINVT